MPLRPLPTSAVLLAASMLAGPAWPQDAGRVIPLTITDRVVQGADVASGRPVGTVRVRRDDEVTIRWQSDEAVTLHLHGYNVETKVGPGRIGEMRFRARATGRFPIETHGTGRDSHRTLVYIEVHPR